MERIRLRLSAQSLVWTLQGLAPVLPAEASSGGQSKGAGDCLASYH